MKESSKMARGGLYTSLGTLLIYLAKVLPTSKLAILTVVACIIPLSILTIGIKHSTVVFIATTILGFLFGGTSYAFSYLIFFGAYGFIKLFIERLNKAPIEIILKLIYFNIALFLLYNIASVLFVGQIFNFSLIWLILGAQVAFFIYDYAFTLAIAFINEKLLKK